MARVVTASHVSWLYCVLQCHLHKAGISRLAGTTCSVMRNQTATVEQKAYFSLCSSILKQEERKITKVFNSFEFSCTCELWRTLPFWENSEPARFCTANSVTNKSGRVTVSSVLFCC